MNLQYFMTFINLVYLLKTFSNLFVNNKSLEHRILVVLTYVLLKTMKSEAKKEHKYLLQLHKAQNKNWNDNNSYNNNKSINVRILLEILNVTMVIFFFYLNCIKN